MEVFRVFSSFSFFSFDFFTSFSSSFAATFLLPPPPIDKERARQSSWLSLKRKQKQKTFSNHSPSLFLSLNFFKKKTPQLVTFFLFLLENQNRLATVMLAREGGVEKALEAVPFLHDETHAYIKTVSLLAKNPALGDVKNWQGMSSASALGITKNYTSVAINDLATNTFAAGAAAIEPIVNAVVPDAAVDAAKWNATTTLMNNIGNAVSGPLEDATFLANLNSQLKQFNIVVTGKSVAAPKKFNNAATIIGRVATGKYENWDLDLGISTLFFFFQTFCQLFFSGKKKTRLSLNSQFLFLS